MTDAAMRKFQELMNNKTTQMRGQLVFLTPRSVKPRNVVRCDRKWLMSEIPARLFRSSDLSHLQECLNKHTEEQKDTCARLYRG